MGKEQFSGPVVVRWLEDGRNMQLLQDVIFTDSAGIHWIAVAGDVINGASIPRPLWSITGSPFVGLYRRATVLHDVYCVNRVRGWRRVHKMLLEAMLADGVSQFQAWKMYMAVLAGGPRWKPGAPPLASLGQ